MNCMQNINKEDVLKDILLIFRTKASQNNIVDLCIAAMLEAMNVNLHIFQKQNHKYRS